LCGAVKSGAAQSVNPQRFAEAFQKAHFFGRYAAMQSNELGA
jgi:hypothetical protein